MPSSTRPLYHSSRPDKPSRPRSKRGHIHTKFFAGDADPALMLAAIPLVSTLRRANAHAMLHGGSGTVVFLSAHRQDALLFKEAAEALSRATRRKRRRGELFIDNRDIEAARILNTEEKLRWGKAEAKALLLLT